MKSAKHVVEKVTPLPRPSSARCAGPRKDILEALEPLSPEMKRLDDVIHGAVALFSGAWFPEADDLSRGGKRLRAALCIAAAKASSHDPKVLEIAIELAAYLEGIHLSSLLHDDVIDNATERRGIATLQSRYGRTGAILAGDMLYVKIFQRLLAPRFRDVVELTVQGVIDMVEGETWQTMGAVMAREPKVDEYLQGIGKKTAGFFRASCEAGARLGLPPGSDPEASEPARTFGYEFGMAFQIIDDILDWNADPELLGKDLQSDIKNRKLTLPILTFLAEEPSVARPLVDRAMDGAIVPLANELQRRGHIERAYRAAETHAAIARSALGRWKADTTILHDVLDATLDRAY